MLDVKDIRFNYGNLNILNDITFNTERGECVGIIGPNGSGKSTLLKTISKILSPASGSVILCGKDISGLSNKDLAKDMAVVPQDTGVDFEFSCHEIVMMGRNPHLKRFEFEGKRDYDIVKNAMELTGTWKFKDRPISQLSGGERQRVIIARALAQEPSVLLLDEPVSHLDINHQIEVLDLVQKLKEEKGLVIVIVIHDLNLAARYCDRLILLHDKGIMKTGTPEEVITRDNIKQAFNANVLVRRHPVTGFVYVTLLDSTTVSEPSCGKKVHIVSGAGTGTSLMYALHSKGYDMTAGVLNVLDTDHETAGTLQIKTISEAPFSPITPESYAQNVEMMKSSDMIVLSGVPIGWGNLKNAEALLEVSGTRPIVLYEPDDDSRDFTDGQATMIKQKLKANGAMVVKSINELLTALTSIS